MGESSKNPAAKAVFISYASQDALAAKSICDALRQAGVEVWFDQSELRGGDAWDQKIRRQIRDCALFLPVISRNTQARGEGYFRREWKLAVDRTLDLADHVAFLMPVALDGIPEKDAHVPEKFHQVQWARVSDEASLRAVVNGVRHLLAGETAAPSAPAEPVAAAALPVPRPESSKTPFVLGGVLAAGAVAGAAWWFTRSGPHEPAAPPPLAEKPAAAVAAPPPAPADDVSIAVLPFVNMSSDKEQEYFSDGLAEELLDLLAKVPNLRVIARTSSFSFKGKNADISTIASQLHTGHVLEGSVRKSGDRLRITVQLIRAADSSHLWSETYDRKVNDVFAIQDEIAGAVVDALKVRLLPNWKAQGAARSTSAEAHEQTMLARQFYHRGDEQGFRGAYAAAEKAIALDPNYAPAHAILAEDLVFIVDWSTDPTERSKIHQRSRDEAELAVRLDPNSSEARLARGYVLSSLFWEWKAAQDDFEKALALDPNSADAHIRLGSNLCWQGKLGPGIELLRKAAALDPLSARAWRGLGIAQIEAGQYAEAQHSLEMALTLFPDYTFGKAAMAYLLVLQNQPQKAREVALTATSIWGPLGVALAEHSLGHPKESQAALDQMIAMAGDAASAQIADVHAWRGEWDEAYRWLDKAAEIHDGGISDLLVNPFYVSQHQDPRFQAILRKINLAPSDGK